MILYTRDYRRCSVDWSSITTTDAYKVQQTRALSYSHWPNSLLCQVRAGARCSAGRGSEEEQAPSPCAGAAAPGRARNLGAAQRESAARDEP